MRSIAQGSLGSSLRAVEFRLTSTRVTGACCVCLVGSFNQWNPATHQMRLDPDGDWCITVFLPPGEYAYLFLADGQWCNDPCDDGRTPSGWGNDYSLKVVR